MTSEQRRLHKELIMVLERMLERGGPQIAVNEIEQVVRVHQAVAKGWPFVVGSMQTPGGS